MNPKTKSKLNRCVLFPGAVTGIVAAVLYFQIDAAMAERETNEPPPRQVVRPLLRISETPRNLVLPGLSEPTNDSQSNSAAESEVEQQPLLSSGEALALLQAELLTPWTRQAHPEHRIISRAGPRIRVKPTFDMESQPLAGAFLGVVSLERYRQRQQLPVVIDRRAREVFVFSDDQWVSAKQWLNPPEHDSATQSPRPTREP